MSKKLNISQINNKKQHKSYKATLESIDQVSQLCKFLRNHSDRKLDVSVNNNPVSFDSIAGRKKFAQGFQMAANILSGHMKEFAEELFLKINSLTSELDRAKRELREEKSRAIDARNSSSNIKKVYELRSAAWRDRVVELEEACDYLMKENIQLKKDSKE